MIRLVEHIPAFCTIDRDNYVAAAETTAEILALEWIDAWSESDEAHTFFRYSVARDGLKLLMVEMNDGDWWWCVATIVEGDLDLPTWTVPDKKP